MDNRKKFFDLVRLFNNFEPLRDLDVYKCEKGVFMSFTFRGSRFSQNARSYSELSLWLSGFYSCCSLIDFSHDD